MSTRRAKSNATARRHPFAGLGFDFAALERRVESLALSFAPASRKERIPAPFMPSGRSGYALHVVLGRATQGP